MRFVIRWLRAFIAQSLGEFGLEAKEYWEIDLILTIFLGGIILAIGLHFLTP